MKALLTIALAIAMSVGVSVAAERYTPEWRKKSCAADLTQPRKIANYRFADEALPALHDFLRGILQGQLPQLRP